MNLFLYNYQIYVIKIVCAYMCVYAMIVIKRKATNNNLSINVSINRIIILYVKINVCKEKKD